MPGERYIALSKPSVSQTDKLASLFRDASDTRSEKAARQTFVTLRHLRQRYPYSSWPNRLASATPATAIGGEILNFRIKHRNRAVIGAFRGYVIVTNAF